MLLMSGVSFCCIIDLHVFDFAFFQFCIEATQILVFFKMTHTGEAGLPVTSFPAAKIAKISSPKGCTS